MANHEPTILSPYSKGDIYTYRVPTPPRIVVPPPALNADAVPEIAISALHNSSYKFLQKVDYNNIVQSNAPLEWTYERRREAQKILPFLCLGPMTAAKDEAWLQNEGVTMVLGIRQKHTFESKLMNSALRTADKLNIEHHTIDLASNQDLIHAFPAISQLVNDHISRVQQSSNEAQFGKVLIFCESGNERSAGAVAAYLMENYEDVNHITAMQLCQAQRFCVNFDDGMKRLLQGYWDILTARRTVAANAGNGTSNGAAPKAKRQLEREEDDDVEMDMDGHVQDDVDRFGGRTFVPFVDQEAF